MTTPDLPPPDLEDVDYELWGQNVKADCWFAAKMRAYGDARAAAAVLAEREKSEAMRAAVLGACGALHGDGVNDQGEAWDKALRILDAARAAIRRTEGAE